MKLSTVVQRIIAVAIIIGMFVAVAVTMPVSPLNTFYTAIFEAILWLLRYAATLFIPLLIGWGWQKWLRSLNFPRWIIIITYIVAILVWIPIQSPLINSLYNHTNWNKEGLAWAIPILVVVGGSFGQLRKFFT